jgi:hypothetical protein
MIFVDQYKYPKIVKFSLPLFYVNTNIHKKFGTNWIMFDCIFSYMLKLLVYNYLRD